MKTDNVKKRRTVLANILATVGGLYIFQKANAATTTPSATEGPFYPKRSMRKDDADNDLVQIADQLNEAGGEIIRLKGQVVDKSVKALPGLRVEIWQCDMNGVYLHTGDSRSGEHDNAFQGFGHDITDDNGRYRFRTIKPAKYPGRTPHIHVKVCTEDKELLTTQFYLKNDPDNGNDSIFKRLTQTQADAVSMVFPDEREEPIATVNITLS